jgi:hypothetical protein
MNDTKNSMPNLFRSLRADATEPSSAGTSSVTSAEGKPHRVEPLWPILSSVLPKKSPPTVSLTDQEKLQRRALALTSVAPDRADSSLTAMSSPSVSHQLASGLARMLGQPSKAPLSAPTVASVKPSIPVPQEIEPPSHASDDSLIAVFKRLEQAHQAAPASAHRPPAFLSRLGKR